MGLDVERIRFGPYELDRATGELTKFGHKLRLQDQPFQILVLLLARPGEVVTREQLQRKLWSSDTFVDFEHGLNNAIKRLREILIDSAEKPRYIETLPRRGYRFIAPVEEPVAAATSPVEATASVGAHTVRTRSRWELVAAAAVLVLALIAAAGWRPTTAGTPPIHSLAVLPLQNRTGDPGQDYFVDGMTDELTTSLAQTSALRVISRTSMTTYTHTHKQVPQIGRELNVDGVVEGSVARSGERVRINVQLVQASTDRHLWAKSYEGDLKDVLALQREVDSAITSQIRIHATPR